MATFNLSSDGTGHWEIRSSAGLNRVMSAHAIRRETLRHAMALGEYEASFSKVLAWKPVGHRPATFGSVRVEWVEVGA